MLLEARAGTWISRNSSRVLFPGRLNLTSVFYTPCNSAGSKRRLEAQSHAGAALVVSCAARLEMLSASHSGGGLCHYRSREQRHWHLSGGFGRTVLSGQRFRRHRERDVGGVECLNASLSAADYVRSGFGL